VNFVNCKIRVFVPQKTKRKKEKKRVCKKHKRALDKFLTSLISEPMIPESFENSKAYSSLVAGNDPGKKCAIKHFPQLYVISFE
jgi:hypothetical protein